MSTFPQTILCAVRVIGTNFVAWLLCASLLPSAVAQTAGTADTTQQAGTAGNTGHAGHAHNSLGTGAAIAPDGTVWLVGLNTDQKLFVQQSRDPVRGEWSAPRVLDTGADAISADGENRPKIAFGPNGAVVISYTQPLDKPYTGRIRMLHSEDGGLSFSSPFTVHHDNAVITHRFESIAFDGKGDLHVVWIDKRDQVAAADKHYVGAAIYQAISHDGGRSFDVETKVAEHSCECCRVALATDGDGVLHAMWRHVFGQSIRDHAFANLQLGPAPPIQRASFDEWNVQACPHQGPGLAWAGTGDPRSAYHAVWFGIRKESGGDVPAVRYARLDAKGAPVTGTVRRLPDVSAEHADVAAIGARVLVVWRSFDAGQTRLRSWTSTDNGQTFSVRDLGNTIGNNDQPHVITDGQRMLVLWRTDHGVQVYESLL